MKLEDFLGTAIPGQMTVDEVIAETAEERRELYEDTYEPVDVAEHVTWITPSGVEVFYSWHPRRYYKLRQCKCVAGGLLCDEQYAEVPSVTNVLNVLSKDALPWWGMKVGVEGMLELFNRKIIGVDGKFDTGNVIERNGVLLNAEDIVSFLTAEKLTVNHVKDSAATRGVNVHSAFEKWAEDQSYRPIVDTYPETEQGYIRGLIAFLDDFTDRDVSHIEAEVMVGSIEHGFAGRYDLRLMLEYSTEMVTRVYPKRAAKRETIPAGKYLLDLKTSKHVYPTHALQLAAYEMASVECGYGPTDHRAVVHVTQDGRYELVQTHATEDDFLNVLAAHNTMAGSKAWT